ncbi:hypothetical protein ARMA_2019 [Ardenticatena maritima]|uniref:uroporphyrinogen-III C-methyltransferase n=2 Tax=Ardenticatena maritima TaxID=872965 RepID=A0A0M8KAF7_9CHLR|nr:uroporphyrinogen-III C-methyltransferase [Ardenticatena maritima]GAP63596.1 hypothetical protein ARMA_2019 [Ardenticatena maritima]
MMNQRVGKVYLVGSGPGAPDLITVRGLRALQAADVVVYDRLAPPELLDEAPPHALRFYVGKAPGRHVCSQEEINALLIEQARLGRTVVRLKGGDPFVFGRGGEEMVALAEAGIPFEVVPGITSAVAAPAAAAIPVTHREVAPAFAVVTGHEAPDKCGGLVEWAAYARVPTLVVLMGVRNSAQIAECLIAAGRSPDEPVAIIANATLPDQQVAFATLGTLAQTIAANGIRPPATIVIGEVVAIGSQVQALALATLANAVARAS